MEGICCQNHPPPISHLWRDSKSRNLLWRQERNRKEKGARKFSAENGNNLCDFCPKYASTAVISRPSSLAIKLSNTFSNRSSPALTPLLHPSPSLLSRWRPVDSHHKVRIKDQQTPPKHHPKLPSIVKSNPALQVAHSHNCRLHALLVWKFLFLLVVAACCTLTSLLNNLCRVYLAEEQGGQEPTVTEVFVRTHSKKKTGQLVSSKAQKTTDAMTEALKEKYGDDSTQHPRWDVNTWLRVVGGRPHGHTYGLGSAVSSKVRCVSSSSQQPPINQPPGYLDNETVERMFQERFDALEQRYKEREEEQKRGFQEREEEQKRGFEEREAIRNEEYKKDMKQAIYESQLMFIQALRNTRNDGASTSQPLRPDKAPMEGPHHQRETNRSVHHQANWYDPNYDNGDEDSDDDVIFETDGED